MHQIGKTKAYEKEDKEERPPWVAQDTPKQRRVNAGYKSYIHDAQKAIEERGRENGRRDGNKEPKDNTSEGQHWHDHDRA
jgi:hypothetical protein